MFFIITTIVGLAASLITIKTLVGYAQMRWWWKLIVSLFVLFCWCGHSLLSYCRHNGILPLPYYTVFAYLVYFGLAFGFILLALILVRDFTWFSCYGIAKIVKSGYVEKLNPFNVFYLNVANIIVVVMAILLTAWGGYAALKFPQIKEIVITDDKIKSPLKMVMLSDLHVNRIMPVSRINNLVENVNKLNPDVVVIVGDVVDEAPNIIEKQMEALSKLNSKYGTYIVFGNHDFYSGMLPWLKRFSELKLNPLFNSGLVVGDTIYLAGVPDKSIEKMSSLIKIDLPKALSRNKDNLYTVLLSHTPKFSDEAVRGFDLQLSGHTHGGQIFPFHFLVKSANKYLAGMYQEDGYKVYVSRGTGYWGPPVRLFAPSEITVINFEGK